MLGYYFWKVTGFSGISECLLGVLQVFFFLERWPLEFTSQTTFHLQCGAVRDGFGPQVLGAMMSSQQRVNGPKPGPGGWAQAGPKLGPSWAQNGLEPEMWDPPQQKIIKVLKIKIRVAQNVGKVWISRKKSSQSYLVPSDSFLHSEK